jgi:hypothetical protein
MSHETLDHEPSGEDSQREFEFPGWEEKKGKKLAHGYRYNEAGEIVDWEGNIYDESGKLKSTPATPELETEIGRLKQTRPELANNREALMELAKINVSARKNGISYETKPYPPLDN